MYSKTFNTYVTFQVLKGFNGLYSGYRLEFQVHTLLGKSRPAIAPLAFVLQVIKFWIKSVLLYWTNSVKRYFLHRLTVRQKYCCRVFRHLSISHSLSSNSNPIYTKVWLRENVFVYILWSVSSSTVVNYSCMATTFGMKH